MDFLSKIKKHLVKDNGKEFRKQVLEEKKQKYLFSDKLTDKYRSSRSSFFTRKKRVIAPFTNVFWENYHRIKNQLIESRMLAYMWLLLIWLSWYIIFFSPYFRVSPSHVLLEAKNDGIDISVAYRTIEDIYGTSLFLLDEEEVALTLKKSLKNISHITIEKLYPNWVKVLISSTPISYTTRITGFEREWQMSNNGVLIPKISSTWSGSAWTIMMEVVSDTLRWEVFFDYKQIIDDEKMTLINKIYELFSTEWKDLSITKIRYFSRENEVHLTLKSNTVILLTLESESNSHNYSDRVESIKYQLIWLKTFIEKNTNSLTDGTISYIDTRIVKKLFICKDSVTCKNNLINIYGETYK